MVPTDLVSLPTGGTLVEGRGLEDVAPAESDPLADLRHGGLVLGQVGPGEDGVQVGALHSAHIQSRYTSSM